jgi:hypothetical protein
MEPEKLVVGQTHPHKYPKIELRLLSSERLDKHVFMTTDYHGDELTYTRSPGDPSTFNRQTESFKVAQGVSRNSSFIICRSGIEDACGPARNGASLSH